MKTTKTYRVQIEFNLTLPKDAEVKNLAKQIKENFYLYSGKDTFFEGGRDGEYVTAHYSKFEVRSKEVK